MLNISHTLQTPLTILTNRVESLPGVIREPLLRIIRTVSHSIKQLLHMAQLENQQDTLPPHVPVDLSALCELLQDYCQELGEQNQITTTVTCITDCTVLGDYNQIEEVITTIFENAVKYMPEQAHKEIHITLQKHENFAQIVITDNGRGIPAEEQDRLFERFFRSSRTRHLPGTGLGLAIAREIIDQHQGTITLESQPGATTFTISLPIATS